MGTGNRKLPHQTACRAGGDFHTGKVRELKSDAPGDGAGLPDRTWVEIDLGAVRHNVRVAQECFAEGSPPGILAVVKADGYGLGMLAVARAMAAEVRGFAVANVREAAALREAGMEQPVYLLGPALPEEWDAVAAGGFCAAVSSLEEVTGYGAAAARRQVTLAVHVVVDTGMGRIGVLPEEASAVVRAVQAHPALRLDSVASHFPSADEDPVYTREQTEQFEALLGKLQGENLAAGAGRQLANSAGLLAYPPPAGHWARAGLMLYGVSPLPAEQARLRQVVTWKTRVSLVKMLPAGHGVSYGRTFITTRPTRVATLAAGYADGFPRQASGHGAAVLLGGQRCAVLGRVTMDQIMVDATDLTEPPRPGDEAVLVGVQGNVEITAPELAAQGGTNAWDLFTGLGPRVRRCYVGEVAD